MKTGWWLALAALCVMLCVPARAEQARDLTGEAEIQVRNGAYQKRFALDRNVDTGMKLENAVSPWIEITLPEAPCAAVYLEFGGSILPFCVLRPEGEGWEEIAAWDEGYAQAYVSFPPQPRLRIAFDTKGRAVELDLRELFVYSEGERDEATAHVWQPQAERANLLVLVAHPDDELLWLGGALPCYAGEKGMDVTVAYMTCARYTRRLELLNGLWCCGVRTYPDIGAFRDIKSYVRYELYQQWGGQKQVDQYVVRLLRRYRPQVVLTHALDGEYGHAAHRICPDSLLRAVELAADPAYDPQSAAEYGAWQVSKLYVHKTAEGLPETLMNWREPLAFFGGRTAFEVAEEAYRCHQSQPQTPVKDGKAFFYVVPEDEENSSFVFTLVYSAVGPDEAGGDFFEHII